MKHMLLFNDAVAYLREHPTAEARYEDYTVIHDKKTDSVVIYHHDPSASHVWGLQPITHIPTALFQKQFRIIELKAE